MIFHSIQIYDGGFVRRHRRHYHHDAFHSALPVCRATLMQGLAILYKKLCQMINTQKNQDII